jgi:hypothetical protein
MSLINNWTQYCRVGLIISCYAATMFSALQHAVLLEKVPTYEPILRKARPNAAPHAAVKSLTRGENKASHKFR